MSQRKDARLSAPSDGRGMPRILTAGALVFVVAFIAFELSVNGVWATDHATSFVQLDYAMWHDHSFALTSATKLPPWSVDDFLYGGQNYSALAPGTAFLALPFTGLGFALAGQYTAFGPVLMLSETFVALMGAGAAYLVYAIASLYFRRSTALILGFAFAFSTPAWPMATYFFQSDVSAVFVLLAVYLLILASRREDRAPVLAALSGLAAGVAFTVDYVNGILLPVMLAWLLLRKGRPLGSLSRSAVAFLAGSLPGLAAIGYYNYAIFGSPFTSTEQHYLGVSSVLGSFSTAPWYGLSLDLFSFSRGLLIFAPFLFLGVIGFIDALKGWRHHPEMVLLLAVFLGILIPYSMWRDPTGGLTYGPRFLTAAIPFLLLPAGFVVDRAEGWRGWGVLGVYAAGAVMNGMAALVTAIPKTTGFDDSPFLSVILPGFIRSDLDTAWGFGSPYASVWGAMMIAALAVVIPILVFELMRRRDAGALPAA